MAVTEQIGASGGIGGTALLEHGEPCPFIPGNSAVNAVVAAIGQIEDVE
jgi:hypothetical protein